MQYVSGGTLRDQLSSKQPLEPHRASLYALQMARALHHAHLHGIVHRDVKPANMLISATNPNELLLSDFGIARLFERRQEAIRTTNALTNEGNRNAVARPDIVMKQLVLLCLRMHPLSSHMIIRLPCFLPP